MTSQHHRIVIVGSGFSGIGMAVRLLEDGERDFVLLERASELGGTWRDNTYPGCRCDVPSHLYSFSFAPNPNWSSTFSPQPEILEYLRDVAQRFGVTPHVRFEHELRGADWDEEAGHWRLDTSQGELTADVLVAGQGPLSDPRLPDVPGIGSFEGTMFHSAHWDHEHDLERRARGGGGHRRVGDPVRARDPARRGEAARVPAHPALDHAAPQPAHEADRARALPPPARGAAGDAGGHLLGARVVRAPVPQLAHAQAGHQAGRQAAPRPGARPRPARAAHAALRDGLQAHPAHRRVVSGHPAAQRRGADRGDRRGAAATRSSAPTAASARWTRSSSGPAST